MENKKSKISKNFKSETRKHYDHDEPEATVIPCDISILEYARCHSMMMFMMLVFFGILIIPFCISKMRQSMAYSTEATISQVFYSQSNPNISLVSLRYMDRHGVEHVIRETLDKIVKVNDTLTIYIIATGDKDEYVFFHTPCCFIYYLLLLLFYIALVITSIYMMSMHYYR